MKTDILSHHPHTGKKPQNNGKKRQLGATQGNTGMGGKSNKRDEPYMKEVSSGGKGKKEPRERLGVQKKKKKAGPHQKKKPLPRAGAPAKTK